MEDHWVTALWLPSKPQSYAINLRGATRHSFKRGRFIYPKGRVTEWYILRNGKARVDSVHFTCSDFSGEPCRHCKQKRALNMCEKGKVMYIARPL